MNLVHYATHQPFDFAWMMVGKIGHMWHGAGDPSYTFAGSAFHYIVVALGLFGLALLALRRRWEVLPIALLLVGISFIGGLLLAGVRRNLPVMPIVLALAGVAVGRRSVEVPRSPIWEGTGAWRKNSSARATPN